MMSTRRYPNIILTMLDLVVTLLLRQTLWSLDMMMLHFFPVTTERENMTPHLLKSCVFVPIYALLLIMSAVLTLPWLPVWVFLQRYRKPYYLSTNPVNVNLKDIHLKSEYTLMTTNVCMISEFIARLSNSKDTLKRANKIGSCIAASQTNDKTQPASEGSGFQHGVSTTFPADVDFICFQEVCDNATESGRELTGHLHKAGYHVIYDVGVNAWNINYYLMSSWLAFASKYPILDVAFHPYTYKCSGHTKASTGLLLVKVYLGAGNDGKSVVGIIADSHLQAEIEPEKRDIHVYQLDSILKWEKEFRDKSVKTNETVAFSCLGADFNFDNLSPGDKQSWSHRFFDIFHDVCRVKPGEDCDWTIGTEMRLPHIYDEEISTPEKLHALVKDKYQRPRYFYSGNIAVTLDDEITWEKGIVKEDFTSGKRKFTPVLGRRRVDGILYKKQFPVEVKRYTFVTQLVGLTDHIPVCMTFSPKLK